MIFFFYGRDTYRSKKKLNEVIEKYGDARKDEANLKIFDFKGTMGVARSFFRDFEDAVCHAPLFRSRKLVILKNTFLDKEFQEKFLKSSDFFLGLEDTILFYEERSIDKKAGKLFEFLKTRARSQEFAPLKGQKLKEWVKKEFAIHQTEIEAGALDELACNNNDDLWRLSNEIKKIACYKNGEKITKKDIEILINSNAESNIFKTVEAIAERDKKTALRLLHKHLEKGDAPSYLLSMVVYQFRNLLIVKRLLETRKSRPAILKESGLHPYVFNRICSRAQCFTLRELKEIYQKIFQVELSVVTGKMDPVIALDLLVSEFKNI